MSNILYIQYTREAGPGHSDTPSSVISNTMPGDNQGNKQNVVCTIQEWGEFKDVCFCHAVPRFPLAPGCWWPGWRQGYSRGQWWSEPRPPPGDSLCSPAWLTAGQSWRLRQWPGGGTSVLSRLRETRRFIQVVEVLLQPGCGERTCSSTSHKSKLIGLID